MNRTIKYPTILLLAIIIMLPIEVHGQQNGKEDFRNGKTGWNTGVKSGNKIGADLKAPATSIPNICLQDVDSLGNKGLADNKDFFRQDKLLGKDMDKYPGRYPLKYG